jgi:long-chain acyl-CoA synthetase
MPTDAWSSLPAMMLDLARQAPQAPMLRFWRGGAWQRMDRRAYAMAVTAVASGLRQQGIAPGDRVMVVAESRPEWLVADCAIMAIGAVTVPTYTTNTAADHAHIRSDSGARAAIVSTPALAKKLREAGGFELIVCMDDPPPGCLAWAELLAAPGDVGLLLAEAEEIPPGRLACIVYTSGTGGKPKGVMLPHRSLLANRAGLAEWIGRLKLAGTPYLSFLPLSHSYEHTVCSFLLPSFGIEVVFSRGAERLSAEFRDIRPTVITAVPRLFEVLRGRIEAEMEKATPFRQKLFRRALALGLRRMDGPALSLLERAEDLVLDRLVRSKVRERFGGRLVAIVSGGARLDPALSGYFLALGVPVLQGYGQTEAGPVVSVNLPWDIRRETVGPPLQGVEVAIAPDGEVLLRGDLVMDGYWNDPAATAAALHPREDRPGEAPWLHTGDVGALEDGRLRITDRKRDFIKTLGGDMVSPAKVEGLLMAEPAIAQAVIAGEGKPAIAALIVPAEGAQDQVEAAVARVNAQLSGIERIRRVVTVEPFTLENGMLTPTMKVKRRVVLAHHAALLP